MNSCFVFDLDGTVTQMELLPLIAGVLDLEKEMKLLTQLTLSGQIPFEDSFRLRCACLQAAPIDEVRNVVSCVPLDPEIEEFIKANKDNCIIITGNLDVWIEPLIQKLGCQFYCSTAIVENNTLKGVRSVLYKNHPVLELKNKFSKIIAIGDGVNDIPMFEASDICIAYGGIHLPAKMLTEIADYIVFQGGSLCRLLNTLS